MPKRVQLSRKRGWRMPENTVKVDRTTDWGNPIPLSAVGGSRYLAVEAFREYCNPHSPLADAARVVLRGKNLACWCPLDQPCHADVLLELANAKATP
jgi:hypothetical protein